MSREEAAIEFEHGWNYEGSEVGVKPAVEKGSAWEREYGKAVAKLQGNAPTSGEPSGGGE